MKRTKDKGQSTAARSTRIERLVPNANTKVAFQRLTRAIGGPMGTFLEAIRNSLDAKAGHIWITVEGRGRDYSVKILDDGVGMDHERRQRFVDMANENLDNLESRGYQNLGAKRAAADFERFRIQTFSQKEDDGLMRQMDYSFDDLWELLCRERDGQIDVDVIEGKRPTDIGLPEGTSSGTLINFYGSRENPVSKRFESTTLIGALGDDLSPSAAKKVFVNGQPLKRRQLVGELPPWEYEERGNLGKIDVRLYVPTVKSHRDELKIGADDPVCRWADFRKRIPEEVYELYASELQTLDEAEGVFGDICVAGFRRHLNAFRSEFEGELFTSDLMDELLVFLRDEVVPEVSKVLGDIKKAETSKRDERLLDDIGRYTNGLRDDGDGPPPSPPRPVLQLNVHDLELVSGEKATISVVKHDPTLTLAMDDSACGGSIKARHDGLEMQFTAGKVTGNYVLALYYKERQDVRARVDISIVSRKVLKVSPERVKTSPGRDVTFEAVNWKDDSSGEENLRWRLNPDDLEGRFVVMVRGREKLSQTGYGAQVRYRAGSILGTYRVECFDKSNRRKTAHGDVTISEPPTPPPPPPGGGTFRIGNHQYKVSLVERTGAEWLSRRLDSKQLTEILINKKHASFEHASEARGHGGRLELCLWQIVHEAVDRHAQQESMQLSGTDRQRKAAELYKRMIEHLKNA